MVAAVTGVSVVAGREYSWTGADRETGGLVYRMMPADDPRPVAELARGLPPPGGELFETFSATSVGMVVHPRGAAGPGAVALGVAESVTVTNADNASVIAASSTARRGSGTVSHGSTRLAATSASRGSESTTSTADRSPPHTSASTPPASETRMRWAWSAAAS